MRAPLFSLFSILKRSLRTVLVADGPACSCAFSFPCCPLLNVPCTSLYLGLSANMDNFWRLPISLGFSSSTFTLPALMRWVSPTEQDANRRYGESSLSAGMAEFEDGCGDATTAGVDGLVVFCVFPLAWFISCRNCFWILRKSDSRDLNLSSRDLKINRTRRQFVTIWNNLKIMCQDYSLDLLTLRLYFVVQATVGGEHLILLGHRVVKFSLQVDHQEGQCLWICVLGQHVLDLFCRRAH